MSAVDPEGRARLEEDRDFLLKSLDDLDLEHAAGDVDEADYHMLSSTYTTEAARAIRALAADEDSSPRRRSGSAQRTLAWIVGVVVVAAVAGVLLAQFSGSRRSGESIAGDIRTTTRELLFEAQQVSADGNADEALALYDEVIEMQPANVEALTYRGWLSSRIGDLDGAVTDLDDAIAIDPAYADARVFRAIVALDLEDPETAAEELAAFDALDPPTIAQQLVINAQLRERIARARVTEIMLVEDPPPFSESGLTVADVSGAAEVLAADGELLTAVQLFDAVLDEDSDNIEALTYRGWLIARAGDPQLLQGGIEMLDEALAIDPSYAPALVFRAFALNETGDSAAARVDLSAFDALADQPTDLIRLIAEYGLRESVSSG